MWRFAGDAANDLLAGTYALHEEIGSGVHGTVYRASLMLEEEPIREVALKRVATDPQSRGNKILLQRVSPAPHAVPRPCELHLRE